jgi:hypothetical protein
VPLRDIQPQEARVSPEETVERIPIPSPADRALTLVHDPADRYYELLVDEVNAGLLVYGSTGSRRVFTHAYLHEGYRGQGLVTPFIAATFDDLRRHGNTLTNYCPVIGRFLATHPDYTDLVDRTHPGDWDENPRAGNA